ncbi:MAG: Dabb family protein [Rubrivivax sp.]|nr:Dabb family protein [Rubrivivax sp.]
MIKHIVMWNVRGDDAAARARHIALVKSEFESLRGRVPGLLHLEVGVDESRIDYACDVVLYTEFTTREALAEYAVHPEHLRVRAALGDLRVARHQVDFESPDEGAAMHRARYPLPAGAAAAGHSLGPPESTGDKPHVQAL